MLYSNHNGSLRRADGWIFFREGGGWSRGLIDGLHRTQEYFIIRQRLCLFQAEVRPELFIHIILISYKLCSWKNVNDCVIFQRVNNRVGSAVCEIKAIKEMVSKL